MRVLLTNDDGIEAEGLGALRRELLTLAGIDLRVIAPDGNRSAIGRGITTRRPLRIETHAFGHGEGLKTDGTPVDCVRLATLGLIEDWAPELVVAGINHGVNLGDDVTYSGTVAAAMEGLLLGLPAIAASQQSDQRETDLRQGRSFAFDTAARFVARLVEGVEDVPLPPSTLLNVNVPAGEPDGLEVCRLGKRVYHDRIEDAETDHDGSRTLWIYGTDPGAEDEPGTDLAAVQAGRVAVTPLHLDLTHHDGLGPLTEYGLAKLLAPAAEEVR